MCLTPWHPPTTDIPAHEQARGDAQVGEGIVSATACSVVGAELAEGGPAVPTPLRPLVGSGFSGGPLGP